MPRYILFAIVKPLIIKLLRIFLPLALVLAQHGVWAHGFSHDAAKIAAHGQTQDHTTHACCLPFEAAGNAACGAPRMDAATRCDVAVNAAVVPGRCARTTLPYLSHAPPLTS